MYEFPCVKRVLYKSSLPPDLFLDLPPFWLAHTHSLPSTQTSYYSHCSTKHFKLLALWLLQPGPSTHLLSKLSLQHTVTCPKSPGLPKHTACLPTRYLDTKCSTCSPAPQSLLPLLHSFLSPHNKPHPHSQTPFPLRQVYAPSSCQDTKPSCEGIIPSLHKQTKTSKVFNQQPHAHQR